MKEQIEKQSIEEMAKIAEEAIDNQTPTNCPYHPCCYRNSSVFCDTCVTLNALYNAGYRKQSENVIELPCKVGDMVYMPWEWDGVKSIACLKVTTISNILDFGWSFGTDFDTDTEGYAEKYNYGRFKFDDVGKIVFLTREDAEAKMKGGAE